MDFFLARKHVRTQWNVFKVLKEINHEHVFYTNPNFYSKEKTKWRHLQTKNWKGLLLKIPHEETLKAYALGRGEKNTGGKSKVQERIVRKETSV